MSDASTDRPPERLADQARSTADVLGEMLALRRQTDAGAATSFDGNGPGSAAPAPPNQPRQADPLADFKATRQPL